MDNSFDNFWKDLMKLRYPALDKIFIFNCNLELEDIVPIKNKFWQDLNKYFFELRFWDELNQDSVIWFKFTLEAGRKNYFLQGTLYLLEISLMTTTYLKHLMTELKINMIVELIS